MRKYLRAHPRGETTVCKLNLKAGRLHETQATVYDAAVECFLFPDAETQHYLCDDLGIDAHNLHLCLDPNALPRVEIGSGDYSAALILKLPLQQCEVGSFTFQVGSAGLFLVNEHKLIVVLPDDEMLISFAQSSAFVGVEDLSDLMIHVVYHAVRSFQHYLQQIHLCSEQLEEQLATSATGIDLLHLFELKKSLVYYRTALSGTGAVLQRLMGEDVRQRLKMNRHNTAMLDDVAIEYTQAEKVAHIYSEVITDLMNTRASTVGNNLNKIMMNLTAVVIGIAIPTFVAGMGGMSEFSAMIGFEDNWLLGYSLFLVGSLGITVVVIFLIRKLEPLLSK
eukprot:TRINITY_DN426_c0_g2_i2.p1 TRINITY_DN426_c0_g2~~TRINITY_DN426_c0_g2_i2.p1  ORF type:complete len:336 (-),score=104.39 TRINITY_DN426_c0_g2_i2:80-1087(-)